MSDERERLLHAVEQEVASGRRFAVATIVGTRGSTYRHAGARLLVRADGSWLGNLSGGCLEGEVIDVGRRVIETGVPELVDYDLTADEEAVWGWGLGCNGAIDVFVEPGGSGRDAVEALRLGADSGRPHVLVTVLGGGGARLAAGAHLLVRDGVDPVWAGRPGPGADAEPDPAVTTPLVEAATAALDAARSERRTVAADGAEVEVFLEVVRPPLRLLVCGAGHDAIPVVRFARQLGWDAIVVDDRSAFLTTERFPEASGFLRTEPAQAGRVTEPDANTYVVVMSHNFLRDVDYLGSFLGTGVAYLGMLGPRRRLERLLAELAKADIAPDDADRAVLHGPAGLDLGAEGPEEIAWAICAEILGVSRSRPAGYLRDREGPIHDRDQSAMSA